MRKQKIVIPYIGNEKQASLHIMKIFIGGSLQMEDLRNHCFCFARTKPISFRLNETETDMIEIKKYLDSLGVKYTIEE